MKCPRIFVSPEKTSADVVCFSGKDARYLHRVLRLRPGDEVEIYDGTQECLIRLTACDRGTVHGRVIESRLPTPSEEIEIILGFSTIRPGPIQEILRHGTELGVSRFVPVISRRANRRPAEKKERWKSVVASASAQSRRSKLPEVEIPLTFDQFIERENKGEARLLLSTEPGATPILVALEDCSLQRVVILAGPEGGMEESEVKAAINAGFLPVSLVRGILRSETAAIVAAATVILWHDWQRFRCMPVTE